MVAVAPASVYVSDKPIVTVDSPLSVIVGIKLQDPSSFSASVSKFTACIFVHPFFLHAPNPKEIAIKASIDNFFIVVFFLTPLNLQSSSETTIIIDRSNKISILFEDEYIIGFSKPAGVVVHHSNFSRLKNAFSLKQLVENQEERPLYPIHRLDGKTTGVILFAKNKESLQKFQSLFKENNLNKSYWAILRGFTPTTLVIEKPIGPPKSEKQRLPKDKITYKEAKTILKTLAKKEFNFSISPYPTARYSLVELIPFTGRTHQLRNHTNHIAHPIIGDHKYGDRNHNRYFSENLNANEMFLHARVLEFEHPFTKKEIRIEDEVPESWENLSIFQELKATLTHD